MGRDGASLGLNYMGPMFTFMNKPDGGGANTKMRRDVVALSAGRQKHTNFADLILAQFRAALLRPANPIPTKNPEAVFNILLRRCPLKVWQSVIGPVSILMVALIQSCSNSVKRIQHQAVNLFRSALQIHTEVAILIHRRFKNSAIGAATGKVTFNPSEITDAVLPIKPHNWFPSFIHVALLLLSHLLCNSIYAANPAFSDFNTTQFGTNGGKISIKSGAVTTNAVNRGILTVASRVVLTNSLASSGSRNWSVEAGPDGSLSLFSLLDDLSSPLLLAKWTADGTTTLYGQLNNGGGGAFTAPVTVGGSVVLTNGVPTRGGVATNLSIAGGSVTTTNLTWNTETLSPSGSTNFVLDLLSPRTALITATADVNWLNSTNRTGSTATERSKKVRILASGANRLVTLHSSWLLVGTTTRTFTVTNGTWLVMALDNSGASETNVFVGATYAQ